MEHEITQILNTYRGRPEELTRQLIPAVYGTLREMARARMRRERGAQITLQPTALVHEAFMRVFRGDASWENRRHFFGAAAEAMRRVLIERVRWHRRVRHGGSASRVFADLDDLTSHPRPEDPLLVDDALDRLEAHAPRKALVVKLRYFVGLSIEETAQALELSTATVKLDWAYSRAWLRRAMRSPPPRAASIEDGRADTG